MNTIFWYVSMEKTEWIHKSLYSAEGRFQFIQRFIWEESRLSADLTGELAFSFLSAVYRKLQEAIRC